LQGIEFHHYFTIKIKTNPRRLHTTELGFYIEEVDQELFSLFLSVDCDFKLQQKMEQTNDHLQSFLNIWIADYSEMGRAVLGLARH
jgi:hypothetical protein